MNFFYVLSCLAEDKCNLWKLGSDKLEIFLLYIFISHNIFCRICIRNTIEYRNEGIWLPLCYSILEFFDMYSSTLFGQSWMFVSLDTSIGSQILQYKDIYLFRYIILGMCALPKRSYPIIFLVVRRHDQKFVHFKHEPRHSAFRGEYLWMRAITSLDVRAIASGRKLIIHIRYTFSREFEDVTRESTASPGIERSRTMKTRTIATSRRPYQT